MDDVFSVKGVNFQKIDDKDLINHQNLMFLFISSSGVMADSGYIYLFCTDGAFYIKKYIYDDAFFNKYFSFISGWRRINLYFCDLLIINPTIYDSFVRELSNRNIRDFWFQASIEIYRDKYCK